jgi:hypothetical protein
MNLWIIRTNRLRIATAVIVIVAFALLRFAEVWHTHSNFDDSPHSPQELSVFQFFSLLPVPSSDDGHTNESSSHEESCPLCKLLLQQSLFCIGFAAIFLIESYWLIFIALRIQHYICQILLGISGRSPPLSSTIA